MTRHDALGASAFRGRRPTHSGDLGVETHGIAPIGEDQRYGRPPRLFTVWFAPQVNMTGVFTGTLAITLGLGFWLGLLAMVIGTVLGSLVVFAVKLAGGHEIVPPSGVQGADRAGAFVLEVTVALSLAISWASYAADYSRYLPADSSRPQVFGFTFAGILLAYIFVQGIG